MGVKGGHRNGGVVDHFKVEHGASMLLTIIIVNRATAETIAAANDYWRDR